MIKIRKNYPLKKFTTMRVGGPARFFVVVKTEPELIAAIRAAKAVKLPWVVVGEGSNLVVSDAGYRGLVIQNSIKLFERQGENVRLGAGNNLLATVLTLDKLGLSGMERMAGIPGTVGGAVYGCAGAYGQEIKDHLLAVRFFDGRNIRLLRKSQCRFGYRGSVFKQKKQWVILGVEFRLKKGGKKLLSESRAIIKLRQKKYPPGLLCPGSFFKNIKLDDLLSVQRAAFLKRVPGDKIMYGKVPAGYLLDEVGARGIRIGGIGVAAHHANLIYNSGKGRTFEIKKLAKRLRTLVKKKFSITIEEEVQYLGNT